MPFKCGKTSSSRLDKADPRLRAVFERALELSEQDLSVFETLRTLERQKQLVAEGRSKTLNSKHLPNKEGVSVAFDVVAWKGGYSWDKGLMLKVCWAVIVAAKQLKINLRWGGVWKSVESINECDLEGEISKYVKLRESQGRRPFVDMAHFEII